ncbi:putative DNA helicase ino80, partial [Elasticomyces elasticus]
PALPKLEEKQPPKERRRHRRTVEQEPPVGEFSVPAVPNGAAAGDSLKKPASTRPPPPSGRTLSERDIEVLNKITAEIENEDKSDVDAPGFEVELERYMSKGRKRALNTERSESIRRKRRRQDFLVKLGKSFEKQSVGGSERFKLAHEPAVVSEVQAKEVQDEKERKKDMQRKRRRENTIRLETQRFLDAELKAHEVPDAVVKAKYLREAERAQKKIKSTKRALEGASAPEEISEVTPLAPNLEGGTTSSFHIGRSSPSRRKSGRAGAASASRPKKSKEQKQAEKDAAEAAYAAMENDESLSSSLLDDPRKEWLKKDGKEGTPMSMVAPTYDSKGYNQIYEQIWRDIARKDIPKVYRIKALSLGTRQENLRKTAQLASKQSRKWQE